VELEGVYRYGFNGKENDNEVKGEGNSLDFGARIYDPRIGRWLSKDPLQKKYPDLSPYNYCANSPIVFVDPNGKEIILSGTAKEMNALVAKIQTLTGLQIELQSNGNLKLISSGDGNNAVSQKLRNTVSELLTEKGSGNHVVMKLINGQEGKFYNKHLGVEETSDKVYFDSFETGSVDMQDFGKITNDVVYAVYLQHLLSERAYVKGANKGVDYEGYLKDLDNHPIYDAKTETLTIEGDSPLFTNAHTKGLIDETAVLNEYAVDPDGGKVKLSVPSPFGDMKKVNSIVRDYKGVKIETIQDPKNANNVQSVKIQTNEGVKGKNGAF
jgi:RHS repeat-associated protein